MSLTTDALLAALDLIETYAPAMSGQDRKRATAVVVELRVGLAQLRAGYDAEHPLVRCPDCAERYTACDLGNHYCPSCGESCEGAPRVVDV